MKKTILFIITLFVVTSCGSSEISSEYFEKNYDAETLTLDLSNKNFTTLPEFGNYMTGAWIQDILVIDISENKLETVLAESFDIFPSVTTINLDANEFTSGSDINIPKSIKVLSLSDNMLENIDGFNAYKNLTQLNLNNNNLEDSDLAELGGFKKLGLLKVEGNNISSDLLESINKINKPIQE